MVLISDDKHHPYYTRSDLHCMNMLLHPIWVFDIDNKAMFWANNAALEHVWNAATLDELLQRDFASDMSETAASIMVEMKNKILEDPCHANIVEQWTLYPRGVEHATTIDITCSGIRIGDNLCCNSTKQNAESKSNIAILVEAEMLQKKQTLNEQKVRSIDLLKHIPVAVSQFTMDGSRLIYQNTKSSQIFGNPSGENFASSNLNHSSNDLNADPEVSTKADYTTIRDETVCEASRSVPTGNQLLDRFVDVDLGKKAIAMAAEKDEEFSAEVQQYTITTTNTKTHSSSERLDKRHTPSSSNENSAVLQQQRWFNVSLRKTRDPVTSDFVILYIAWDISDIVKARKDSLMAAMKSEFLDVMAHEIRTPLHQIMGHIDLLEDEATNSNCSSVVNSLNSSQLASVRQIQSSCSMLMSIINDLLDCSKLENGQVMKEEIQFDLDDLISSCIDLMRPRIHGKRNLQVSYRVDEKCDTSKLVSDPSRIRQILHNLLSNAIKFTSVGSITVTVEPFNNKYITANCEILNDPSAIAESRSSAKNVCSDDNEIPENSSKKIHLQFEVTDTGIGIAQNEQTIVFERYRQANASVSRTYGGTGLGLPICKGLVELLGGRIGLRSELGVGTTIYFDIPFNIAQDKCVKSHRFSSVSIDCAAQMDSTIATTEATKILPPMSTSTKSDGLDVLIVEDNVINQKVVRSMLQRLGHVASIAENGESALTMMRQKQFHLVLMDIQMPIMDGIECTKYIRNVLRYDKEHLPIIGLTASYQPTDRDFYENVVGMNTCVGKPLPLKKLKEAIETHYHGHSTQPNVTIDQTISTSIAAIDVERHCRHRSLSQCENFPSDTPLIATPKRRLEESQSAKVSSKKSTTKLDIGKHQQPQSVQMLEPSSTQKF